MTLTRFSALAVAAALLAGCGGGSKEAGSTTSVAPPPAATTPTQTATTSTSAKPSPPPGVPPSHGQTVTTPENGGSEPARTEVTLTGRGGDIRPSTVTVAPFIAVHVTLVSADGGSYRLRYNPLVLDVNAAHRRASATIPGIPAGKSATLLGERGSTVAIISSGEPGP